jgi:hypothetical protein
MDVLPTDYILVIHWNQPVASRETHWMIARGGIHSNDEYLCGSLNRSWQIGIRKCRLYIESVSDIPPAMTDQQNQPGYLVWAAGKVIHHSLYSFSRFFAIGSALLLLACIRSPRSQTIFWDNLTLIRNG